MPTPASKSWHDRIDASRRVRKDLFDRHWTTNVNFRMQMPFAQGDDDSAAHDRVAVPEDWARTRQKTAQIAYQIPKILASAKRPEYATAAPVATAATNEYLKRCRFDYTLDENMADVINAAGLAACVVSVDVRTESVEVEVPRPPIGLDPLTSQPIPDPQGPDTQTVEQVIYKGFKIDRISPGALLWPAEFAGSDWDRAPWLGYDAWMTTAEAKRRFPSIPKDFSGSPSGPALLSKDVQTRASRSTDDGDTSSTDTDDTKYARVTTIWYQTACYDEAVAHPHALSTVVFVDGVDDPVEQGPSDWQTWIDEQPAQPGAPGPDGQPGPPVPPVPGHYLGLTRYPIRVVTLTYVSDLATPPSDSQAARPQVREMIRSRSQMIRQRDHSVPVRWFDVNRLDELTVARLQNGEWLDMIPVNGRGEGVIGEVARASYPRESFQFASVIGQDLDRTWSMSNASLGIMNDTERSATEVQTASNANDTRLHYEKSRVGRYVAEVGGVLFSLMQRFMDETDYVSVVGPDGLERLQAINAQSLAGDFAFDFKVDSSDRIDSGARVDRALKAYNILAESPTTNRMNLEKEIWEALGFDPAKMMVQPPPPKEEPANISFRFSGEDMTNPVAVALMLKTYDLGQDQIKAAQMLIRDAVAGMRDIAPEMTPTGGGPGAPPGPPSTNGQEIEPPPSVEPILKRATDGSRLT